MVLFFRLEQVKTGCLIDAFHNIDSIYYISAEEMENMNIEETCLSTENPDNNSLPDECSLYDTQAYEGTSNSASRISHEIKGPEILYKSSKQLYKAVAKECGITCKMSDQCRCLDCQSRYFDCEYDQVVSILHVGCAV